MLDFHLALILFLGGARGGVFEGRGGGGGEVVFLTLVVEEYSVLLLYL